MFRPLSQTKFINDANLVSYWKLDGNSTDSKGSNNGTDTSMSYGAGQFDSAGVFNGSSSYITPPTTLPTLTTFSFSFWLKTSQATKSWIWYQANTGNTANMYINLLATNKLSISFDNGSTQTSLSSTASINNNIYNLITITRSGANVSIYINGVLDSSSSSMHNITIGNNQFVMGRHPSGVEYLNGSLDDFGYFSRALSAGEVAELYQSKTSDNFLQFF